MVNKLSLLLAICGLMVSIVACNARFTSDVAEQPSELPNIVLIFVDDMGWAARETKNTKYETPNITQLAMDGMEFSNMYIPTPTCSPSRATLVTGLHPARLKMPRHIPTNPKYGFDKFGRTENKTHLWPKDPAQMPSVNWLDTAYISYAEALKQAGYYNMFIGKWHLGHEGYHPIDQGFDEQIGTTNFGNPSNYYPPYFKFSTVLNDANKDEYLTDRLSDDAAKFIVEYDKKQPFMLSLWHYSIHSPVIGRKDYVESYLNEGYSKKEAHYAAMVKSVDESLGKVRRALKSSGHDKNTMVIFLSDQGGLYDNLPLRGGKMQDTLYDGGARVPFIVSWPGVTTPHSVNTSIVQSTDLFPTLAEVAKLDLTAFENLDGVSLLNTIKNNSELKRGEPIYGFRAYEDLYASVRQDNWKLLAFRSGTVKLYKVDSDIGETNDVAEQYPSITTQLKNKLVNWEREMQVEQYSGVQ